MMRAFYLSVIILLATTTAVPLSGGDDDKATSGSTAHRQRARRALRATKQKHAEEARPSVGWGCYEQAQVLPTFTQGRFPFCLVLAPNQTLLYWDHDYNSTTGGGDVAGVTLTLGLVVRPGEGEVDWLALGLSSEAGGMKGMDVAMLWLPPRTTTSTTNTNSSTTNQRVGQAVAAVLVPCLKRERWDTLLISSSDGCIEDVVTAIPMCDDDGGGGGDGTSSSSSSSSSQVGGPVLEDRWSVDYVVPELDTRQPSDKHLLEAVTLPHLPLAAFAFSMPASNCQDRAEDVWVSGQADTIVTWAYGTGTTTSSNDQQQPQQDAAPAGGGGGGAAVADEQTANTTSAAREERPNSSSSSSRVPHYHGEGGRGGGTGLSLLASKKQWERKISYTAVSLPPDARSVDLVLPSMEVPSPPTTQTSYRCMWVQPPAGGPYHIYSMRLVGNKTVRSKLTHHLNLYAVTLDTPQHPVGQVYDCMSSMALEIGMPIFTSSYGLILSPTDQVYAAAGTAPRFGGPDSSDKYWLLEVHYENWMGPGHMDTPGLQLIYSPTLRPHTAGVIITGVLPSVLPLNLTSPLAIPPRLAAHHHWDLCPSVCMDTIMHNSTKSKARVLTAGLHMHTAGIAGEMRVEHADGSSHTLVHRDHWDYKIMSSRSSMAAPEDGDEEEDQRPYLAAGDRIFMRCSYDSRERDTITRWGPSKTDEMCIMYIVVDSLPGGFACFNTNGARFPPLDYLAGLQAAEAHLPHPVPQNLSFCAPNKDYSVAMNDPQTFVKTTFQRGNFMPILQSDLAALQALKDAGPDPKGEAHAACL